MTRLGMVLCLLLCCASTRAQQAIVYDDDCAQDVDCVATLPVLHTLADRGEIRILAMVADSANPLSAPVMRLFASLHGRPALPIGANQTGNPDNPKCKKNACSDSAWTTGLVQRFDPGDTRSNYPTCVTAYRKALADAPAHSVAIVATGFATCLVALLDSRPDRISPLSGKDLVRQNVKLLSIMGGRYPSGTEWNFESDAPGYHLLFLEWTKQHGYPPVYLNGFENGVDVLAGAPANADPTVDPTAYGMQLARTRQRPMWDALSVLFAARGEAHQGVSYFTVSAPGTVSVDPVTGADSCSPDIDSGHYVLTNAASNETFARLLDGYTYHSGFLASPPHTNPPGK
jgi:hypothetical protein